MVQRAKTKVTSLFSLFIGFFAGVLGLGLPAKSIAQPSSERELVQPGTDREMTQPSTDREMTQPGTDRELTQNVSGLNLLRGNFDSAAFTSWLGAKGYRVQDLSPASLESAVTEFRLKQINDRLDAIEAKTR